MSSQHFGRPRPSRTNARTPTRKLSSRTPTRRGTPSSAGRGVRSAASKAAGSPGARDPLSGTRGADCPGAGPSLVARKLDAATAGHSYAVSRLQLSMTEGDRRRLSVVSVHRISAVAGARDGLDAVLDVVEDNLGTDPSTTLDLWYLPSPGDHVDAVVSMGFDAVGTEAVRFGAYLASSLQPPQRGSDAAAGRYGIASAADARAGWADAGRAGPCTMRMLLARVDVGRSLIRTAEEVSSVGADALPDGYGSVHVPAAASPLSTGGGLTDVYHVYDRSRCVPLMIVEFELVDPRSVVSAGDPAAGIDADEIEGHEDEDVDHPGEPLNRFCTTTGVPTSVMSKVDGRHQGKEYEYVTLDVAYEEFANAIAGMEERREALADLAVDAERHCAELAELATRKAAAYRQQLADYLQGYLIAMRLADERRFEIERCICDIERAGDYLEHQQRTKSRVRFLTEWNFYRTLTASVDARFQAICDSQSDFSRVALDDRDREIRELRAIIADRDRTIADLRTARGSDKPKAGGANSSSSKSVPPTASAGSMILARGLAGPAGQHQLPGGASPPRRRDSLRRKN